MRAALLEVAYILTIVSLGAMLGTVWSLAGKGSR